MSHDTGQHCHCMVTHRPAPLELERHHIQPKYLGGGDTADNIAWVCPTTHTNVHELLRAMIRAKYVIGYSAFQAAYTQPVSRYAYDLAVDGFTRWQRTGA